MALLRSTIFAMLFYTGTVVAVLLALPAARIGRAR
jgi:hypothetical protein